jgi:hypothetical protein|tara:strand:+ start:12044 stop:12778 length:735 start_codon:yes stop_codon:yes gene_type:complete
MTYLYFAGAENPHFRKLLEQNGVQRVLISYFSLGNNPLPFTSQSIFLDSGAYSAFTQEFEINIQSYIAFIKKHLSKIEIYANLDVIGDAEATYKNQKIMEDAGLSPLPCFHHGEDFKWLQKYLDEGHTYIALGGLVGGSYNKLAPWLKKCLKIIPEDVKVHGFGLTSTRLLKQFDFYSVDSTSWLIGGIYGTAFFFNGTNLTGVKSIPKFKNVSSKLFNNLNVIQWKKYAKYLEARKWKPYIKR